MTEENENYWGPLISSILVSLLCGLQGIVILVLGTYTARKEYVFNVFKYLFYGLLTSGFLVRSLYFLGWIWPGTPETKEQLAKNVPAKHPGMQVGLRVFFLTFP